MHRFFLSAEPPEGDTVPLPPDVARQCARVLRLRPGARLVLFCGDGTECEAVLDRLGDRDATARIVARRAPATELGCELEVALAVLKGEKLDWVVQKLTELGAARISLLETERTVVAAGEERWPRRVERLRRIAREAAEQCGRVRLPQITEPRPLEAFLATLPAEERLAVVLTPEASVPLIRRLAPCPPRVTVLVGPEGGFSAAELARAEGAGMQRASLGPRILRAETAAIVAAALVAVAVETPD